MLNLICLGFPLFEANVGPVHALVHFASDKLKQEIVPQVCKGGMVLAVSMSEPQAGSALTDLTTKGEIKDGKVTLNGQNVGARAAVTPTAIWFIAASR